MDQAVLSLRDVTLRYGDRVAVRGLSLGVRRGEVLGLLGPNGSGKSSTLAAIAGSLPPARGTIQICGRCERDDPMGYRRLLGLVPQDLALFDDLGCAQNLSFFGRLYGLAGRALKRRVEEVLDLVRLADVARRPVRTFSGGMKRRLNLACAVLHRPALLLLDEPTVGLDLAARDAVFAILRRLRDEGCGLVFATHHLEEAERLCDRLAILDRGALLALGTLDELYPRQGSGLSGKARLERLFVDLTARGVA